MKTTNELDWLNDVNSQSLQSSIRHLDVAFTNFFKHKAKYPNFKKRSGEWILQVQKMDNHTTNNIWQWVLDMRKNQYSVPMASSKMCSCGKINSNLQLSDRNWVCTSCGELHDRDILASNNIKKFGLIKLNYETRRVTPEESVDASRWRAVEAETLVL